MLLLRMIKMKSHKINTITLGSSRYQQKGQDQDRKKIKMHNHITATQDLKPYTIYVALHSNCFSQATLLILVLEYSWIHTAAFLEGTKIARAATYQFILAYWAMGKASWEDFLNMFWLFRKQSYVTNCYEITHILLNLWGSYLVAFFWVKSEG